MHAQHLVSSLHIQGCSQVAAYALYACHSVLDAVSIESRHVKHHIQGILPALCATNFQDMHQEGKCAVQCH